MAAQPFDHLDRQMRRADEIGDEALSAPEGEKLALKAMAPEIKAARQSWEEAQAGVSDASRKARKETDESQTAIGKLKLRYAEYQPLAAHKAGFEGRAPTRYDTDDDFFVAVEDMEAVLQEHRGQDWADGPLAQLTAAADASATEYTESVKANRDLQKTQLERSQVAEEIRPLFVVFRKCVRGTYGNTSKEYRDLLDKQYRKRPAPPTPTPSA